MLAPGGALALIVHTVEGRPVPRAVLPRITLQSPKITRKLTTEWFARRVDERYRRCLSRPAAAAGVDAGE